MESKTRKIILTVAVGFIASVCVYAMIPTSRNFVELNRAYHGIGGVLVDLEMVGEDTILFTFRYSNDSSLELTVENIQFNLYANRVYLGNFNRRERMTLGQGDTDIVVEAQITSHYLEKYKEQLESKEIHWFLFGGTVIELPFEKEPFSIDIREEWVSV